MGMEKNRGCQIYSQSRNTNIIYINLPHLRMSLSLLISIITPILSPQLSSQDQAVREECHRNTSASGDFPLDEQPQAMPSFKRL